LELRSIEQVFLFVFMNLALSICDRARACYG
jgi:hypothetical protein